jgi:hypothetical protein
MPVTHKNLELVRFLQISSLLATYNQSLLYSSYAAGQVGMCSSYK